MLVFTEKGPLVKTSAKMTEWAQKTSKLLINSVLVLSFPDQQYFFPKKKNLAKTVMKLVVSITVFALSCSFIQ